MKTRFWTSDWFAGLVVASVFFAAGDSAPLAWLDGQAYDAVASLTSERTGSSDIAVVAIDDDSIHELGSWPWPRDRLALLIDELKGAKVLGLAIPLREPQYPHVLDRIGRLRKGAHNDSAKAAIERVRSELTTDEHLAVALRRSNVVLGNPSAIGSSAIDFARLVRLPSVLAAPAPTSSGAPVLPMFSDATVPFTIPLGDTTGRAVPLAVEAEQGLRPTFAAALIARSVGVTPQKLEFHPGQSLGFGSLSVNTDAGFRMYPRYAASVPVYSFNKVIVDRKLRRSLAGSTLLVGLTAPGLVHWIKAPDGRLLPPVIATAEAVADALKGSTYTIPAWAVWMQLGALAVAALYVMFLLPRFRTGTAVVFTVLLIFVLANAQFILMSIYSKWVPLMVPVALLVAGFGVMRVKRWMREPFNALQRELSLVNRKLGEAFHAQGQLDQAFESYRNCAVDSALLEQLYNLGLDYERKRRFNRAVSLFSHMKGLRKDYRDVADRITRNQEMENMVVLGKGGTTTPTGTVIMSADGLQKPMLGRYQIERELGRGAMGLVYLGKDPKIGRTVAIKTMALSQEFDDTQIAEVRERFFREAETAGRLDHPGIVTVYDVGEEQDLAYIAMDYLKGSPLSEFCKKRHLLSVREALEVTSKVAEALDYAHGQNVVHRDIKPANIIYDRESGSVKVTDFGVACLTDSSKTKTGTVLGSPSYMSPEQLAGNKVDGRSDLFSLGVMLFQLLTGELPFKGDTFATLMYRIANEKHPDARSLRKDLPTCTTRIINKALQKQPAKRYETGGRFAEALRRCQEG